jgi:hypothetical protein
VIHPNGGWWQSIKIAAIAEAFSPYRQAQEPKMSVSNNPNTKYNIQNTKYNVLCRSEHNLFRRKLPAIAKEPNIC